jgi:dTMP kinase
MNKGFFITIEGPDGAGKSTQIRLLIDYLKSIKKDVVVTREPGGTAIGEDIRKIVLSNNNTAMDNITEALLYAASRAQHVKEKIIPALEEGKVVICDRFVDSSIVYQGIGRDLGIEKIQAINDIATNGLRPDVTLLLKLEPEIGLSRKKRRNKGDRLEMEAVEFHKKVYNGYKQLEQLYPDRIIPIDAAFDIKTVSRKIIEIVDKLLKEGEN